MSDKPFCMKAWMGTPLVCPKHYLGERCPWWLCGIEIDERLTYEQQMDLLAIISIIAVTIFFMWMCN